MKDIRHRFLAGLCMLAVAFACQKPSDDPVVEPQEEEDTYEATITITSKTLVLGPEEGASANLVFQCDHEWKIVSAKEDEDTSWLTFSKTEGSSSKNARVKITATANTVGEKRSASFRIRSGSTKKKFTVTQEEAVLILSMTDIQDFDKYYKPAEFKYDMLRSDSQWSWCRSKQSEHFVVFWGKDYGPYGLYGSKMGVADTSPTTASNASFKVDIDDLLEKAEEFYRVNIDVLKFADTGKGKSQLDKYKMQIYLLYQSEWLATGGGYDDVIGALWINPSTCQPVGSTIAHEIGHSFQYQVYADAVLNGSPNNYSSGWRYGIGQGCGFWEQSAQWQSYQSYAEEAFSSYNFTVFKDMCHGHFLHEHQRYASYWLMWYWADKHGVQEIGELWRYSKSPEDPCETYIRKHGLSIEEFNAEIWDYAARCTTWDFDVQATSLDSGKLTGATKPLREFGKPYIGSITWSHKNADSDGYYPVSAALAPEATGFNHIELKVPAAGGTVTTDFAGTPNAAGYQSVKKPQNAGWTLGYAALLKDGTTVYSSPVATDGTAEASFEIPSGTSRLWLVVAATPSVYMSHRWDEDDTNDEVWPYKIKISGSTIL